MTLLKTTKTSV